MRVLRARSLTSCCSSCALVSGRTATTKIVYITCCCTLNSKSAKLDVANALGQTPLLLLLSRRAVAAVEELIRQGANVHKTDAKGEGFLFYLLHVDDSFERLLNQFLSAGGAINAKNALGVR